MTDLAQQEQELIALWQEHTNLGNGQVRQLLGLDESTIEQMEQALVASGQPGLRPAAPDLPHCVSSTT